MKTNPLKILQIAVLNLKHCLTRTVGLVLLVAFLSFVFFGGAVLSFSMQNGLNQLKERMGADIMIVPLENEGDLEAILLKGEPSCFYFGKSLEEKAAGLEGVKECSSQFFLTSLDAECCDTRVQLIGFDPDTDFSVQPWISKVYDKQLADGAVIIGNDIHTEEGKNLKLFDTEYEIAAKLDATGTGLDQAVYANTDTIKKMYAAAYDKGQRFLEDADPERSISAILIRVADGYDKTALVKEIRKTLGAVQVVESQNMITDTATHMGNIAAFLYLFTGLFLFVAFITLFLVFSLSANERKKEFAILRTIGATRKTLAEIILTESTVIGLIGGLFGIIAAAAVVFPLHVYIGDRLGMPYLLPSIKGIVAILILDMAVSLLVGALSAVRAAVKISHAETFLTMREGE